MRGVARGVGVAVVVAVNIAVAVGSGVAVLIVGVRGGGVAGVVLSVAVTVGVASPGGVTKTTTVCAGDGVILTVTLGMGALVAERVGVRVDVAAGGRGVFVRVAVGRGDCDALVTVGMGVVNGGGVMVGAGEANVRFGGVGVPTCTATCTEGVTVSWATGVPIPKFNQPLVNIPPAAHKSITAMTVATRKFATRVGRSCACASCRSQMRMSNDRSLYSVSSSCACLNALSAFVHKLARMRVRPISYSV